MNPETLPYALLLLLAEFTAGSILVLAALELRGLVPLGYVKVGAGTILVTAALALAVLLSLPISTEVGGYPLAPAWITPARIILVLLVAALLVHNLALYLWPASVRRILSVLAAGAGFASLLILAAVFQQPTWGYAGEFLSLLTGGLSLGSATLGMLLGHWYLVNPRLSEKPLNELIVGMLAILLVQTAVVAVNAILPVRQVPASGAAVPLGLGSNPAFWLRVAVGLVFPLVLGYMAWQSSRLRGMMSATGLLYIAMGAVLAGQALARGLLFVTGAAV